MKKNIPLFLVLIIALLLFTSCNYLLKKPKENNHYTQRLTLQLNSKDNFTCSIIDMNFYKEKDLLEDDFYLIDNFIKVLNEKSFVEKPATLGEKPIYKMMLNFNKEKYVINVYNSRYITLHPWDGKEEMDYIDMKNIPTSYNLFYLCSYIFSGKA